MANNIVQLVDSISTTPTVLLDLNDDDRGGYWSCESFDAPPPRLRRSVSQNAMTDGGFVSSSSYEMRVLRLGLALRTPNQDQWATEFQKLARVIDTASSFLRYQPNGASKPTFFKLYRSDVAQIEDFLTSNAFRKPAVELLAEPFALGLRESFTSSFGFDGSTTGFEYVCPAIVGDVAAPLRLDLSAPTSAFVVGYGFRIVAQSVPSGVTSPVLGRCATNASLGTLGTDTTATTGLGTAAWNGDAATCSFATVATMTPRLSGMNFATPRPGTYRAYVKADATGAASTYQARLVMVTSAATPVVLQTGATVTVNQLGLLTDLGLFRIPFGTDTLDPRDGWTATGSTTRFNLEESRTSGSGSLRVDGILFVPTDMDYASRNTSADITATLPASTTPAIRCDADSDSVHVVVLDGLTVSVYAQESVARTGRIPSVAPASTNTLWLIPGLLAKSGWPTLTDTTVTFTGSYYPRYLYVRPQST